MAGNLIKPEKNEKIPISVTVPSAVFSPILFKNKLSCFLCCLGLSDI